MALDMETSLAKKYAAILEILILISIAFYIINKAIINNYVDDVKSNFSEHREKPAMMFGSSLFGKSPKKVLIGAMGSKTKTIFGQFLGFLTPIFKIFEKIFKYFETAINRCRNLLKPIRTFFNSIAEMFFKNIQNFTIGVLYSLHKMRNSMRRSVSGFNLMIHSLEHSKNSLESLVNSEPVKLGVSLMSKVEWLAKNAGSMMKVGKPKKKSCFDENTILKKIDETLIKIKDIAVNDILYDGSMVISIHKFKNFEKLYDYRGVFVSGSHAVLENNRWVRINKSSRAILSDISPEYIYCINTTSGEINIDNIIFKDYNESVNNLKNLTINSLVLSKLNNFTSDINIIDLAYGNKYLECGFGENTKIEMNDFTIKFIKDIKIGDVLRNNNRVYGIVKISGDYVDFYKYNDLIITSSSKVKEVGLWKNVEKTSAVKIIRTPIYAYNIYTDSGEIPVYMGQIYRDYEEIYDEEVNDEIDNLVLND